MRVSMTAVALVALLAAGGRAAADPRPTRKALVVGVNRYDAHPAPPPRGALAPFQGAVADAQAVKALLEGPFHFDEVKLLDDQRATRAGILEAIRRTLVEGTRPGDVRVFFFSGHGAQVPNPASPELDKLDETIVPYDYATAPDLRDKELARALNKVIDAGGVVTVVLDSCHSGSGLRGRPEEGPPPGTPKDAPLDPRAVSDPGVPVPPEMRGALVVSAAQDLESAYEVNTPAPRGALTTALVEALQAPGAAAEPAGRIFLRARQRLRALSPQTPVLAGSPQRQRGTFFEAGPAAIAARTEVAVTRKDDVFVVDSGAALGLGVGSVLERKLPGGGTVELEVQALDGPARAYAVLRQGTLETAGAGGLFEVARWATPPGTNLVVQVPDGLDPDALRERAADLQALRDSGRVEWLDDPEEPGGPALSLIWEPTRSGPRWRLYGQVGSPPALTPEELRAWRPPEGTRPRVVAVLPPPAELAEALRRRWAGPGGPVAATASFTDAHYRLEGHLGAEGPAYGWARTSRLQAGPAAALPARTDRLAVGAAGGGPMAAEGPLADLAERLARGYAWLVLQSPPANDQRFAYCLALQRQDGALRHDGDRLRGGESYGFLLEPLPGAERARKHWVYVFAMDKDGRRSLLFPGSGDVENQFPRRGQEGKPVLLSTRALDVVPPWGTDTYFLLATETKFPDLAAFDADPVRTRKAGGPEEALPVDLLAPVTHRDRGFGQPPLPLLWSLRRTAVTSVATDAE